jgi:hypothetical protein
MNHEIITLAKIENWDICTYGLGYLGKRLYNIIPDMIGLSAQYYCDGDDGKVDSIRLPGMKGIHKEDLIKAESPKIIFILVDDPYDLEIQKKLSINDYLHTVTLRELALMDDVIESFYGEVLYKKYKELPDYSVDQEGVHK